MVSTPNELDGGEFDVVAERTLAGRLVETIARSDQTVGLYDRFTCGDYTYFVSVDPGPRQALPPGFTDNSDFLTQLIEALGC